MTYYNNMLPLLSIPIYEKSNILYANLFHFQLIILYISYFFAKKQQKTHHT